MTTIALTIEARTRDLGDGFTVGRVLPSPKRRLVGPFIFFDHMGPTLFEPGRGIDVRPHPHIGLATVTYLFDGAIMHRDSLGSARRIEPGDVNWMTAGRGIVHSERTAEADRRSSSSLHGIQSWIALPLADEEAAPSFTHTAKEQLPSFDHEGVRLRLIAGSAYNRSSPVAVFSRMFYLDGELAEGHSLTLPEEHEERAVYVVEGAVELAGERVEARRMAVLEPGGAPTLKALTGARVMLLGGEPLTGERFIWWNFVSSDQARIEQAKQDWRDGRFASVPGETEFIPLPED
ncbi:hypothetical protein SAMN06265365_105124 [Tistlia consotensis]|uniref:Pirin family protein n=1 Tax=Tistlia consotensis USBA 355 TaxID=560819 RepID=A0A1Y6BK00_9PROT|nr:pirin family protein [Tistlia consotensis]SMF13560.1 hypothetical protein SAMN05428998_105174 [Tistlia consotensis USBA 355]SNR50389.1 hypothetical protein SAMN06265365_105124 [Tistlia consotensis]